MKFPVKKINIPADLAGQKNGKLDTGLLKGVSPSGQMHHTAAHAWTGLQTAAAIDDVQLVHVGAYRPYLRQYQMFRTRYSKTPTGRIPQVTRIWQGATWYLRKGVSPCAVPGTSNHGLGLSIDAALSVNGKTVPISADPDAAGPLRSGTQWLRSHAVNFGFCWEIADSNDPNFEAWHLVYFAGDKQSPRAAHPTPSTLTGGPTP